MMAIYRKELRTYFGSLFGYLVVAILLLFMGLFVSVFNLIGQSADFSYPLLSMQWVLIITVPFLAMRSIAEERHNRTDQLLYSLPMPLRKVVLGKYGAMLTLFLIPTAVFALYPLILSGFGAVSMPSAYLALLGYLLLGAALIAICMYLSSLVENQIIAAVIGIAVLLLLYFMDTLSKVIPASPAVSFIICILAALGAGALLWRTTKNLNLGLLAAVLLVLPISVLYIVKGEWFSSLIPRFLTKIDLFSRFGGFTYGQFDLIGTVFYLCVIGFFLFLTVRSMEKRRLM